MAQDAILLMIPPSEEILRFFFPSKEAHFFHIFKLFNCLVAQPVGEASAKHYEPKAQAAMAGLRKAPHGQRREVPVDGDRCFPVSHRGQPDRRL